MAWILWLKSSKSHTIDKTLDVAKKLFAFLKCISVTHKDNIYAVRVRPAVDELALRVKKVKQSVRNQEANRALISRCV